MTRMDSILHPIFCLFLYFRLVATFEGNFQFLLRQNLLFTRVAKQGEFLFFWGSNIE